jgi:hypothetical protein
MVPASLDMARSQRDRKKRTNSDRPDEAVNQHLGAISTNGVNGGRLDGHVSPGG